MDTVLHAYLSGILPTPVLRHTTLSGGDISEVHLIETSSQRFLLKVQSGPGALAMLEAERAGLATIAATQTIRTPAVFHCGSSGKSAVLIMEYIAAKQPDAGDFERFGHQLAQLHAVIADRCGFNQDNFIGSLPQANAWVGDWTTFYVRRRLMPQFAMALTSRLLDGSDIPDEDRMMQVLNTLCPDVHPSLLHGDLWSGNYLISTEGIPYLIDPAVYFGHYEVDLAMSRLFGGFGPDFYQAYAGVLPQAPGWEERNEIYQLYYLLVHLNLFGASYRPGVRRVVERYF